MECATILYKIANISNSYVVCNEGDVYKNGILYCGKCGEAKQVAEPIAGYGLVTRGRQCRCERDRLAQERKEARIQSAEQARHKAIVNGIGKQYLRATFENCVKGKNDTAIEMCKRYADNFGAMRRYNRGLLMTGGTGTGKTWAAACICNEIINQRCANENKMYSAKIVTAMDIVDNDVDVTHADLVVIDDFGAERHTEYAIGKMLYAINKRLECGKPMIITTNLTRKQMENEQDIRYVRVYDRIRANCTSIQFEGYSNRTCDDDKLSKIIYGK